MAAVVVASSALSAGGRGEDALGISPPGKPAPVFTSFSQALAGQGFRRPVCASIPEELLPVEPDTDRAQRMLLTAFAELTEELDRVRPGWRNLRLGMIIGTSSGALAALIRAFELFDSHQAIPRDLARRAAPFAPMHALGRALGVQADPELQILAACASSALAIGMAQRAIDHAQVDLVIAGGYDAYHPHVAAGFEALGASSARLCQPFRVARDGMVVGEGAALLALEADSEANAGIPRIVGFGASSDAYHITAPQPEGLGLASAISRAFVSAAVDPAAIRIVSAHGTGTTQNDRAEISALNRAGLGAADLVIVGSKGSLGHTLGAAGALETLALVKAMEVGLLPATAGEGPVEGELPGRLLECTEVGAVPHALKLSAAFGGTNVALVLGMDGKPTPVQQAPVYCQCLGPSVQALNLQLARQVCKNISRIERLDGLAALVLGAIVGLLGEHREVLDPNTAIVLASASGSIESNHRFDAKRRRLGPTLVDPRRFPATTPNVAASEAGIALGLTGPCFAVGGGLAAAAEGLLAAHDWVMQKNGPAAIVVAADEIGPVTAALWSAAGWPLPAAGAAASLLSRGTRGRLMDRPRLLRCRRSACAEQGAFGAEAPGWPSLQAVLVASSEPA